MRVVYLANAKTPVGELARASGFVARAQVTSAEWKHLMTLNVGGHLALGRKPRSTVQDAAHAGFRSMQIFASSPSAWKPPVVRQPQTDEFVLARRDHEIDPLVIHAIYLINLASANPDLVRKSIESLRATLLAGKSMEAFAVITHIGSHAGRGFEAVADQIAERLLQILDDTPTEVRLLLENSAGSGNVVGADLAEIGNLIQRAKGHPRLGVALDTAHLAGAGWDFNAEGGAAQLVADVDQLIGFERLTIIHANDSAVAVGSRRDRHANIGDGYIGLAGFQRLLAQPRLRSIPWIMETPDLGEPLPGGETCSLRRLLDLGQAALGSEAAVGQ